MICEFCNFFHYFWSRTKAKPRCESGNSYKLPFKFRGKWRATGVPKAVSEGKFGASQVRQGEKKRELYATGARRKDVRNGALQGPRDSIEKNTTVFLIVLINEALGTTKSLSFLKCSWKYIFRITLKSKANSKNRHF